MLTFRTLDLDRDREVSRGFERDAFMESFGNLDHLVESEEFLRVWLEGLIEKHPESCVHALLNDVVVGELRMTTQGAPRAGYIFFIYVVPEQRGAGIAMQLHDYALRFFRSHAITTARLSVSPTNRRANAFYDKLGYRDLGPRADATHVHMRELHFT